MQKLFFFGVDEGVWKFGSSSSLHHSYKFMKKLKFRQGKLEHQLINATVA